MTLKFMFFNLSLIFACLQKEILSEMEPLSISMIKRAGFLDLDINQIPIHSPTNDENSQSSSHQTLNLFPLHDSAVHHNESPDTQSPKSGSVEKRKRKMPIEEKRKRQAELMRRKRKRINEICNGINCEGISEEERKLAIQQKEKERKGKQDRKKKIRGRINDGNPTQADLKFRETEKRNKAAHNERNKDVNYERIKSWHARNPGKRAQYAAAARERKKLKGIQQAINQ